MNTSDNIDAIAAALAKAQGEIKNPHKSKDNPHFRSKYADIADGLEVARPVLSKHGLAIIQATEVREDDFVIMRTRLVHTSGQFVEGVYPVGRLTKHTDLGACMTYAKRQSLFALIGIAGDTDDMDGADTGTADLGSKNRKPAVVADETKPARVSSYSLKKDKPDLWPKLEQAVREANTVDELTAIWHETEDDAERWPKTWQDARWELFEARTEELRKEAAE